MYTHVLVYVHIHTYPYSHVFKLHMCISTRDMYLTYIQVQDMGIIYLSRYSFIYSHKDIYLSLLRWNSLVLLMAHSLESLTHKEAH